MLDEASTAAIHSGGDDETGKEGDCDMALLVRE
jgi:hypothetical protein